MYFSFRKELLISILILDFKNCLWCQPHFNKVIILPMIHIIHQEVFLILKTSSSLKETYMLRKHNNVDIM